MTLPKEEKVRETEAEAVAFVVCHGIGLDVNTANSDYIQLYEGGKETLMESLERIQRTAAEILAVVMADKESVGEAAGGEACVAVAHRLVGGLHTSDKQTPQKCVVKEFASCIESDGDIKQCLLGQ